MYDDEDEKDFTTVKIDERFYLEDDNGRLHDLNGNELHESEQSY